MDLYIGFPTRPSADFVESTMISLETWRQSKKMLNHWKGFFLTHFATFLQFSTLGKIPIGKVRTN